MGAAPSTHVRVTLCFANTGHHECNNSVLTVAHKRPGRRNVEDPLVGINLFFDCAQALLGKLRCREVFTYS
jgi:hypothetical protein